MFQKKYLKLQTWKLYKRSLKYNDYDERKQRVTYLKGEIERRDLQRKFMFLHRIEINKRYTNIVSRKANEFDLRRRQMRTWVATIKLLRFARFTVASYYVMYGVMK